MSAVTIKKPRFGWTPLALKTIAFLIQRQGATSTQKYLERRGVRFSEGEKARKIKVSLPTLSKIAVKMNVFPPSLRGRPRLSVRTPEIG